jgi:hypothetical protein
MMGMELQAMDKVLRDNTIYAYGDSGGEEKYSPDST